MKGWVYVISNKAMPGVIKVGYSNRDPKERARELGTGSPHNYTVEYEALLDNAKQVEKLAHEMLAFVNAGKEWFECDVSIAVKAVRKVCECRTVYFENKRDKPLPPKQVPEPKTSTTGGNGLFPLSRATPKTQHSEADTQYNLGVQRDTGIGAKKNLKEAYRLFLAASMQGHTLANLATGKAHLTGRGASKSPEMAIPFILVAATNSNAEAQYHLANLASMEYLDESQCSGKSHEEFSFEMMRKSAEQNYLPAVYGLGLSYSLKNEYALAADCYRNAAEQGFSLAQRHLANCLVDGRGCKRDLIEAKHWYVLAANGNDKIAMKRLENWNAVEAEYGA